MTQTAAQQDFDSLFQALTGNGPLSWQRRLFQEQFVEKKSISIIDLPTGLGKTMVMAIWLIAHIKKLDPPTRLIYVVDRRTVVDQATDLAEKLVENWEEQKDFDGGPPPISTLRGQRADNREWSRDPSRPAIIIGTVDLIGSALLFSGYRSGFKSRPLEAGLFGQDSLLVLDEAHLSKPFEKLLGSISDFQKSHGNPMQVIHMSATGGNAKQNGVFRLDTDTDSKTFDLWSKLDEKGKETNQIKIRFEAKKCLTITTICDKDDLNEKLAGAGIELAKRLKLLGKRIVIFVRKPEDAKAIAKAIREHIIESVDESGLKPKRMKNTPYVKSVEVLTGTMRGLERDELLEKTVLKRFLDGDENPNLEEDRNSVFLVSTSAGEVGFDLNADHLVCDATTIDSLIQRLGRVNRRGLGKAEIHFFVEPPKKDKDGKPKKLEKLELAIANTIGLLQGITDVGPKNIAALKSGQWKDTYAHACSPDVPTVELTDVLLDAWSMTSITERMPGRPDVAPWLRGIEDEQAQTTIAWRAELELFSANPDPEMALQAIFIKHRIHPHESLTVNTGGLLEFFKRIAKLKDRPSELMSTRVAVRLPRGQVECRTLQQLIDEPGILYADSTLILPAKFGGLDDSGMLDAESIPKARKHDDAEPPSLDVADHGGYEQTDARGRRLRILIERSEDGSWTPKRLPSDFSIPESVKLKSNYDKSTSLFNDLKAADLRVRLVQPIHFDDEGDADKSVVILAPAPNRKDKENQRLIDHVRAVEDQAKRIVDALGLAEFDPVRIALLFAAKWHDEGKKAHIWQVFANNPDPDGVPLGKIAQARDPKSLRRYRHEFGSLLRIHHPERCGTSGCELPIDPDAREHALHLIATHHGMARPHFLMAVYHDFTDTERDAIHTDSIRRFARLQRKYGWWHLAWLENLLRCADALASAEQDAEDDPADGGGDAS